MRIILTFIFISITSVINAQKADRNSHLCLYALAIDSRIKQGDPRLPKSIIINDSIWEELKELQSFGSSIKLDSMLKSNNWSFINEVIFNEKAKPSSIIKSNKILPYLKNSAILYKANDWSIEASKLKFSKKCDRAALTVRTSSKNEVLSLSIYFFECRNEQWILTKELAPWLM
ncbi:hypothetical protein [Pedobacter cryotolerans]|nr:hypothetical protein [Pedobacter cryotolerans]